MTPLTARQAEALSGIILWQQRTGFPPTHAELGRLLGVSAGSATDLLRELEKRGAIRRLPRCKSNIEVLRMPPAHGGVPSLTVEEVNWMFANADIVRRVRARLASMGTHHDPA